MVCFILFTEKFKFLVYIKRKEAKIKTILFLLLALIMALVVKAQAAMLFELDFAQDGIFENCWIMQLNDEIKVDIYTSNVPSPGLISIGIDFIYDPVNLEVTPEAAVDMSNWDVAPQIIFKEGEVQIKGGRLLPGFEGERKKLGTVVYGYDKNEGYVREEEDYALEAGKGYWILLNEAKTYSMIGEIIDEYNLSVQDGWYMIGGCSSDAKASAYNCNIGVIYGYEQGSGYKRVQEGENLKLGKGYWILLKNITDQASLSVRSLL